MSVQVIRRLFGETDETELSHQTSASWAMSFKQPASEYIKFRETLDREFVALENVVLKNEVCHMIGTIKVIFQFFSKSLSLLDGNTTNNIISGSAVNELYKIKGKKIFDCFFHFL